MSLPIDLLAPQKSHIDLNDPNLPTDFGLDDYKLSSLLADVMLIEFADLIAGEDGGDYVMRNGLALPVSKIHNAWRKGKVILAGPNVEFAKVGDIVVFPNNMGIPITNLEVENYGRIKNGLFLNEQRIFGICKVNTDNEEGI